MEWLSQTHGIINRYKKDLHLGTQPVRVVHEMLIYMFQNTHPNFVKELAEQIEAHKLNNELNLVFGEESIKIGNGKLRTPRIDTNTKKIELHESFLSFLWCCTYSVFVKYVETISHPRINKEEGEILYPISQSSIDKAEEIFNYAKYLIVDFQQWDKETLPNPEIYLAENRNYVEQTNCYYTEAVKFILCHEFTHLKYHVDQIDALTTQSHFLSFEMEADNNAIDMMMKGLISKGTALTVAHKLVLENGIIFGILSMFFFSVNTKGVKHPNAEDRLTNALERLKLTDDSHAWGIACVGLKMWDEQFELKFNWDKKVISDKEQYYEIVRQIKNRAK